MAKDTTSVKVDLTLNSLAAKSPFNIQKCTSYITNADGTKTYDGWDPRDVGKPASGGAAFTLDVIDADYLLNQTTIGNWVLTFLRRGDTKDMSPFDTSKSSISGTGAASNTNGTFQLDLGNAKIKNAGSWDWSLLVQMIMPDGLTIKCFVSDPEMDVQSILLT